MYIIKSQKGNLFYVYQYTTAFIDCSLIYNHTLDDMVIIKYKIYTDRIYILWYAKRIFFEIKGRCWIYYNIFFIRKLTIDLIADFNRVSESNIIH